MPPHVVELSGVKFRWNRQHLLTLDIRDFQVGAGERLFIHGPSGSGKTTLLNLIAGVAIPEEGEIRILDEDLTGISAARRDAFRSNHMGLIFQMFNLVPYLSLIENVLLPCWFSSARRKKAELSDGGLEAAAVRLLSDLGLDVPRLQTRPVSELSVGQQQRVAAARSLMGKPELIIADEPTSALDADVQEAFLQLLFDEVKNAGATLVFVSHDRRLEDRFDRTISLLEINNSNVAPVDGRAS